MNNIEILAPAGGLEQLIAAVQNGADAVYLGTTSFNARAGAENFGGDSLKNAVAYCHARGVKVHVTLNTLVLDSELTELINTIKLVAQSGADAVIVQDLGTARLVRDCCPQLVMHASTQMTVHNAEGAALLKKLGFSRIVLARELSISEIRAITQSTDLEIEVFVHGALCMCVSGACYLSSMLGGRSGNRGMCAQPCRLDWHINSRDHALSLKDCSLISHIGQLRDIGVTSLKIEGRMKRPEYVAAAVAACNSARCGQAPDIDTLRAVFSRSGFTDGYLCGKRDLSMFGYRTKDDVLSAAPVLKALEKTYNKEHPLVPLTADFCASAKTPISLFVTDGSHNISVKGPVPDDALTICATEDTVKASLNKTGSTPFYFKKINVTLSENLLLPASVLNALRRDALEQLQRLREQSPEYTFTENMPALEPHNCAAQFKKRVRAQKYEQLSLVDDAEFFILPSSEILLHPECVKRFGDRLICELPQLNFSGNTPYEELYSLGVRRILCNNIYAVYGASTHGFIAHGGHGLNITNSIALSEYARLGVVDACMSFEPSMTHLRTVGGALPRGIIAYGYLPLMLFRTCPAQSEQGCKNCTGNNIITDRIGVKFRLVCNRQYTTLYNSIPLYVLDKKLSGLDFVTLYFTNETPAQVAHILSLCESAPDFARTTGLYYREMR